MDNDAELLNTLMFTVKKLTEGAVAGHYQILKCIAVVSPAVRFIEFENYAYTMEQIEQMGQEAIDSDSSMKGYKVKITVQ